MEVLEAGRETECFRGGCREVLLYDPMDDKSDSGGRVHIAH